MELGMHGGVHPGLGAGNFYNLGKRSFGVQGLVYQEMREESFRVKGLRMGRGERQQDEGNVTGTLDSTIINRAVPALSPMHRSAD